MLDLNFLFHYTKNMKSLVTSAFKLEMGNLFTHLVDGDDYGQHSHDFYEFFYITSGTITHKLNNRSMVLSEGDFLFIKPTDLHEFVRPASCTHRDIVFSTIFGVKMEGGVSSISRLAK